MCVCMYICESPVLKNIFLISHFTIAGKAGSLQWATFNACELL